MTSYEREVTPRIDGQGIALVLIAAVLASALCTLGLLIALH
jgi:hypothetical protein